MINVNWDAIHKVSVIYSLTLMALLILLHYKNRDPQKRTKSKAKNNLQ